jgi:acetyl esterase/lipase
MRFLRRLVPALLGLALLASSAGCDWPEGTRFVDRVFTEVEVTEGVSYRSTTNFRGEPVDLKLDIHEPVGDTREERPVVMWMFGGAWVFGERGQMTGFANDSAMRGYVGVTIDYRIREPGADIVASAWDAYDDAVAAVQWLKDNAAEYRIDPDAIVAGGISAGGINAMHLLYAPGTRGPAESPIAGGVAISGLSFAAPSGVDPPSIMQHGTVDPITPYNSAKTTCDEAVAAGSDCSWIEYEGAGHGLFDHLTEVQDSTALLIFERVLWNQGYTAEFPNG